MAKPWGDPADPDSEAASLLRFVEDGAPGWRWVAIMVNGEWDNCRTPEACRAKYRQIEREASRED